MEVYIYRLNSESWNVRFLKPGINELEVLGYAEVPEGTLLSKICRKLYLSGIGSGLIGPEAEGQDANELWDMFEEAGLLVLGPEEPTEADYDYAYGKYLDKHDKLG